MIESRERPARPTVCLDPNSADTFSPYIFGAKHVAGQTSPLTRWRSQNHSQPTSLRSGESGGLCVPETTSKHGTV